MLRRSGAMPALSTVPQPAILAGDLNLRDPEAARELKKARARGVRVTDVWEEAGKDAEHRFTWVMGENRNINGNGNVRYPTYSISGLREGEQKGTASRFGNLLRRLPIMFIDLSI